MLSDVAAEAYDAFMGRYSIPLADAMIAWLDLDGDAAMVDLGCGPGAVLGAVRARHPDARLAAVDPSPSFVAAARERSPSADVRVGSGEDLPFDDAAFDAALAGLVVHFLPDPQAVLAEMRRVTRPGGAVAVTVWDFAGERAPQSPFYRGLGTVIDVVDDQRNRPGAQAGALAGMLHAAGLHEVEQTELTVEVETADFDTWWEPFTYGVSVAGKQMAELDDIQRELVAAECRAILGPGALTVAATAWAARGTV